MLYANVHHHHDDVVVMMDARFVAVE